MSPKQARCNAPMSDKEVTVYTFRQVAPSIVLLETPQDRFAKLTEKASVNHEDVPPSTVFCGVCEVFVHISPNQNWCPFCQQVLGGTI